MGKQGESTEALKAHIAELEQQLNAQKTEIGILTDAVSGGAALYKISGKLETLWYSPGVPALSGHTDAEYRELIRGDAMSMVYEGDAAGVGAALQKAIETNAALDITFRKRHTSQGVIWVRAVGRVIGEENG